MPETLYNTAELEEQTAYHWPLGLSPYSESTSRSMEMNLRGRSEILVDAL